MRIALILAAYCLAVFLNTGALMADMMAFDARIRLGFEHSVELACSEHRACRPIDQIEFKNERQAGFAMECEGGCGL